MGIQKTLKAEVQRSIVVPLVTHWSESYQGGQLKKIARYLFKFENIRTFGKDVFLLLKHQYQCKVLPARQGKQGLSEQQLSWLQVLLLPLTCLVMWTSSFLTEKMIMMLMRVIGSWWLWHKRTFNKQAKNRGFTSLEDRHIWRFTLDHSACSWTFD